MVEQQLMYDIYLHGILSKLFSFSHFLFTEETLDLAISYKMADVLRTDRISGLFFSDCVQVTPCCFSASVYQLGKLSLSSTVSFVCVPIQLGLPQKTPDNS